MTQTILVRSARQLLTLRGPAGARCGADFQKIELIEDGSLLIRNGVIVQIGSTRRIENLKEARQAVEIAADGAVVMPGFVDPSMMMPAAIPGRSGLPRSSAFYDACHALTRTAAHHGTLHAQCTTAGSSLDWQGPLAVLRQLTLLAERTGGISRCLRLAEETPLQQALDTIGCLRERKLAHRIELPSRIRHKDRSALCARAQAEKIGINLAYSGGASSDLQQAVAEARPRMILCNGVLSHADCEALANSGIPVAVAATRCLNDDIYSGTSQRLIQHGATVSLASGYDEAEAPVFNLQMAISLAVLKLGLSVEQAILAATINAAHAAGISHSTGTLEVGKRANLLLLDLSDYRELPRRFGSNHVLLALRDGKLMLNRTGRKITLA